MQTRYKIGLATAAAVLFFTIVHRMLETPAWSFNGSRLMPSFALTHGINFYVLIPPGGPLYSTQYGPLGALVYLPATLFPSPNSAVLAGSAITVLLCFSSVAFLHFGPFARARSGVDTLAFLAAGLMMCYLEPLKYSCFNVHADGPGLALGAFACGALYSRETGTGRWAAPLSAACAVLAVFSKQTFLPVPIGLLIYLLAAEGRAAALRYVGWLAATGGAAAAAALWLVGPERLYHCAFWLPAHHPWDSSSALLSCLVAARLFLRMSMPVPVLLLACLVYLWIDGRPRRKDWRAVARKRWVPLLIVGIALLPFSFAGRAKLAGDINSFSFALFYLTCGLTVMLADIARGAQNVSTKHLAIAVLVAIVAPVAISEAPRILDIPEKIRQLPKSGQEVARANLARHPGEAYFPWFPISHYYAEHRFTHYVFGIVDRELAGEPVSRAEVRAYMPANPRIIAFADDGTPALYGYKLLKELPEYGCETSDPELPGWLVFKKCSVTERGTVGE